MKAAIKKFIHKSIYLGQTPFFDAQTAIEVINECKKSYVQISGIDAVKISESRTEPFMEHSIDYSAYINVWDEAIIFINAKKDMGLYFEVVVSD